MQMRASRLLSRSVSLVSAAASVGLVVLTGDVVDSSGVVS